VGERVTDWRRHLVNVTPEFTIPEPRPKNYKYISDSGMNWRESCFCNHIGKWDKMEILTHPEWWAVSPTAKRDKWEIMNDVKEEAKGGLAKSFLDFRNLVEQYEQSNTVYSKSSKHSSV
jgi:hypothetical protein